MKYGIIERRHLEHFARIIATEEQGTERYKYAQKIFSYMANRLSFLDSVQDVRQNYSLELRPCKRKTLFESVRDILFMEINLTQFLP